jgi:hypothetical protein
MAKKELKKGIWRFKPDAASSRYTYLTSEPPDEASASPELARRGKITGGDLTDTTVTQTATDASGCRKPTLKTKRKEIHTSMDNRSLSTGLPTSQRPKTPTEVGLDKKLVKLARWLGTKVLRLDSFIF